MNPTAHRADEPRWMRLRGDRLGLVLGPLAMAAWIALADPGTLSPEAHRLAGVLLLTVVWWIAEPIPIPATGLLGVALAVVLGAVPTTGEKASAEPVAVALAPFANPTVFFLLGGMFLGRAMSRHGLDRRIAFALLGLPGATHSATTLLATIAATVMFISMWISNTAATAMIYPVSLGIISVLASSTNTAGRDFARERYASALLLMTAYASGAGGIATPIGTTTNVVAIGYFRQAEFFAQSVDFGRWVLVGLPMGIALAAVLVVWLRAIAPAEALDLAAVRGYLRAQRAGLGPWTAGQRNTLAVFLIVVALWIAPSVCALAGAAGAAAWLQRHLPEPIVALLAPVLLFLLPVDWRRRAFSLEPADFGHVDWGTILLFGSGLALGELMVRTGLVQVMAASAFAWLGTSDLWLVTALAIAGAIVLSEFTSNAASATALIPIVLAICQEAEVDALPPLMGVTFGASFGSALPISTPPNAIVYGSGLIPPGRMIVAGVGFDVACGVVIWLVLRAAHAAGWSPFY